MLNDTDMDNIEPTDTYASRKYGRRILITLYSTEELLEYAEDKYDDFFGRLLDKEEKKLREQQKQKEAAELLKKQCKERKELISTLIEKKEFHPETLKVINNDEYLDTYIETGRSEKFSTINEMETYIDNINKNIISKNERQQHVSTLLKEKKYSLETNQYLLHDFDLNWYINKGPTNKLKTMDDVEKYIDKINQCIITRDDRRTELVQKLGERKLVLRADSSICNTYIRDGIEGVQKMLNKPDYTVDDIIDTSEEMNFLYTYTDYKSIVSRAVQRAKDNRRYRYREEYSDYDDDDDYNDNYNIHNILESMKKPAIVDYIKSNKDASRIPQKLIVKYGVQDLIKPRENWRRR